MKISASDATRLRIPVGLLRRRKGKGFARGDPSRSPRVGCAPTSPASRGIFHSFGVPGTGMSSSQRQIAEPVQSAVLPGLKGVSGVSPLNFFFFAFAEQTRGMRSASRCNRVVNARLLVLLGTCRHSRSSATIAAFLGKIDRDFGRLAM